MHRPSIPGPATGEKDSRCYHTRMRRAAIAAALGLAAWPAAGSPGAQERYELESGDWKIVESPDPDTPEGRLALARQALAAGDANKAQRLASAWIKEYPHDPLLPEAYLVRGDALLAQGNEYKALFDYELVARSYPASDAFVTVLQRELEIARLYAHGTKRKFLGIRMFKATDEAEELFILIQERMPGSRLAEEAGIELADFYFANRKMDLAAEMYSIFLENNPNSSYVSKARRRLIYAYLAQFKGPRFDASSLREARARLVELMAVEPATAESVGAEALLERIDESDARKLLLTAQWYLQTGDPVAAELTIRRLLQRYPRSVAATDALRLMDKILPELPPGVLAAAPDYETLRRAILGAEAGAPAPERQEQ